MTFVSLHNHTSYSILDSLVSPKQLLMRAKELNQPAIAITDHGTLAASWEALKASKEIGVKLIIGIEAYFLNDANNKNEKLRHVILLAKNAEGYRNLLTLNRKGFDYSTLFSGKVYPIIDWKILEEHKEGLICLTSCANGIISQLINQKRKEEAVEQLKKLIAIFGDNLGLEVQANNLDRPSTIYNEKFNQATTNFNIIKLAKEYNVRIVPTCNTHYLMKEDAETHDVLMAISARQPIHSNGRLKYDVPDFYLKSEEEMRNFFSRNYPDLVDSMIENTKYFSDLCENPEWIAPKYSNPTGNELPRFPVKDQSDYNDFLNWRESSNDFIKDLPEDKSYYRYLCYNAAKEKGLDKVQEYVDKLESELDVIEFKDISSYMLIVADFLNWCKKNNISVGHGRGSVGGSLSGYLTGIHQADPIKCELIFERFYNKSKVDPSDIDNDIASSDRDKVINYIVTKYGIDNFAQISNFSTLTPKPYVKAIVKAFHIGGSDYVKTGMSIADSIPKESKTIEHAYDNSPLFAEYCKLYPQILKYKKICNLISNYSTHAAGIVIGSRPLTGLVPLRKDKEGAVVLEYEKVITEEVGLVKIDVLGVEILDVVSKAKELILKSKNIVIDKIDYHSYDQKTYDLISSGNTFGVFQFGTSAGTANLCKKVKPKCLKDLAMINALARPAAKDIREDFILAREGKKEAKLLHPNLNRAFKSTYGYGLFDESLMYLAQDVAGWTFLEADKLRKLTKEKGKNPEKVKKWRREFIDGCKKTEVGEALGTKIWDEIVSVFGGYSFNLSHATFYSMLSFETAYLKAHYPVEYLLALLMFENRKKTPDAPKNIQTIKTELKNTGIRITAPDINYSGFEYELKDNKLITGFRGIKYVGDDAIQDIIEKRPFKNFEDFMQRIDSSKVRATTIQALAAVGALDSFGLPRRVMFGYCSDYRKKYQASLKKKKQSFSYLFPEEQDWNYSEKYALEFHYLGEAFVCGKDKSYGDFFKVSPGASIANAKAMANNTDLSGVKGVIKDIYEFKVKKEGSKSFGRPMLKLTIEDAENNQCNVTVFPNTYDEIIEKIKHFYKGKIKLEVGTAIAFSAKVNYYQDEFGLAMNSFYLCQAVPSLPKDFKTKKTSALKEEKAVDSFIENNEQSLDEKNKNIFFHNPEDLIEEIEDFLSCDGLIEEEQEND